MYNQEIKERYLDTIRGEKTASSVSKGRKYLSLIGEYESKVGLDIAQMTREQAFEAVRNVSGYWLSSLYNIVAVSKAYGKWCYDNGIFPESPYGILGISPMDVNPQEYIKEYIFLTEDDLIKALGGIVPIYDGYVEVIACIFAWIGIADPLSIRDSDVFIDGRKIIKDGIVIVDGFSDFIADFLESYKKLNISTRENGMTVYPVIKDKSYDTFIKRFCSPTSSKLGTEMNIRVIQSAINKANKKYEENGNPPKISYKNILNSGSLARLYAAEQNGLDVFDRGNEEKVEKFFYRSDYRSIVWLYRHYKIAFNL